MNINYKVHITKDASKTQTNSSNPWQTTASKNKEGINNNNNLVLITNFNNY